MNDTHILRAFDEALNALSLRAAMMGERALAMLDGAGRAFAAGDLELARSVIAQDLEVDRLEAEIKEEVVGVLARYQPMAVDLRQVLAVERMASDLERVADHAKNIAKRAISTVESRPSDALAPLLSQLQTATQTALRDVIGALKREDAAGSAVVVGRDDRIDALYDDLFHTAVAQLKAGGETALGDVQALFVGKSLERVGDHATNIAEEIRFMTMGERPAATRNR